VDIARGVALCGGALALYKKVLTQFRADAAERLPLLQQAPAPEDLPLFVTQVHALKSALAIIGAAALSARAAALEAAGKAADRAAIAEKLPAFAEDLTALAGAAGAALAGGPGGSQPPGGGVAGAGPPQRGVAEDRRAGARGELAMSEASFKRASPFIKLFNELAAALEAKNAAETDRLLEELSRQPLDKTAREAVERIANLVLMAEYGAALETIKAIAKDGRL
jgi:HPt (histidine-containing phosphotransfer) domain-containing protein